ncbi:MAG: hypothetical protein RIQ46_1243, partial [Pseudomonadota bacterium]
AGGKRFVLDQALPVSMGLLPESWHRLLQSAGFAARFARPLPEGAFGPQQPAQWRWQPPRRAAPPGPAPVAPREGNAFAALADLFR